VHAGTAAMAVAYGSAVVGTLIAAYLLFALGF
jgi:hypothetical protein